MRINIHNPTAAELTRSTAAGPEQARSAALCGDATTAFELAAADSGLRIDVFEADWAGVDRDRARVAARGLADRINVHHRAAFGCPLVRFLLARSGARVVVVDRAA